MKTGVIVTNIQGDFTELKHGYWVVIIRNLSRGVAPETTKKAIGELQRGGAEILESIDSLF
jgi:hypothetical protein